jgi:hypothetical protein
MLEKNTDSDSAICTEIRKQIAMRTKAVAGLQYLEIKLACAE